MPVALPALTRAVKLQRRAGTVGFDWNDPHAVIAKIREELDEFERELAGDAADKRRQEDELGDILFAVANLAPAPVDRAGNGAAAARTQNFVRRFRHIETELARRGRPLGDASLDEMEALWTEAKRLDRAGLTISPRSVRSAATLTCSRCAQSLERRHAVLRDAHLEPARRRSGSSFRSSTSVFS